MRRFLYFYILLGTSLSVVLGQNDIGLNNRWLNRLDHNPATIENSEYFITTLISREQWVGFDGAPSTQLIQSTAFFENINSGFGINILNDRHGYMRSLNAKLLYSYQFQLSKYDLLSLGLAGGLIHRYSNSSSIDIEILEPLPDGGIREMKPDFDFGVEFVNPLLRLGGSITHINLLFGNTKTDLLQPNYYSYIQFNIPIGSYGKLIPGIGTITQSNMTSAEVSLLFYGKDKDLANFFWIGSNYRLNGQEFILLAGLYVTPALKLGYSYDFNSGKIGEVSRGSHEILLQYRFKMYTRKSPCFAYGDRIKSKKRRR